ncbi:MAG: hypothetical protein AAGI54_00740 [Planctomycetota bacterium]
MTLKREDVQQFSLPAAVALLATALLAHAGVYTWEVARGPTNAQANTVAVAEQVAAIVKPTIDAQLYQFRVEAHLLNQSRIYRFEILAKDDERQEVLAEAFRDVGLDYPFKWPQHAPQPPPPPLMPPLAPPTAQP